MRDELKYWAGFKYMDRNEPTNLENWVAYDVATELTGRILRTRSTSGAYSLLKKIFEVVGDRQYREKFNPNDKEEEQGFYTIYDILEQLVDDHKESLTWASTIKNLKGQSVVGDSNSP